MRPQNLTVKGTQFSIGGKVDESNALDAGKPVRHVAGRGSRRERKQAGCAVKVLEKFPVSSIAIAIRRVVCETKCVVSEVDVNIDRACHALGRLNATEGCCGGEVVLRSPMLVLIISRELNLCPGSNGRVGNSGLVWILCSCDVQDGPIRVLVSACIKTAGPDSHAPEIVTTVRLRKLVKVPDTQLQLAGKLEEVIESLQCRHDQVEGIPGIYTRGWLHCLLGDYSWL